MYIHIKTKNISSPFIVVSRKQPLFSGYPSTYLCVLQALRAYTRLCNWIPETHEPTSL